MSRSWRAALALAVVMPLAGQVQAQAAAKPERVSPPAATEPGRSTSATGESAPATSGKGPLLPAARKDLTPGETGTSAPPWQGGGTSPGTEEPAEVGYKGRCGG